jgi:hypothetical protein
MGKSRGDMYEKKECSGFKQLGRHGAKVRSALYMRGMLPTPPDGQMGDHFLRFPGANWILSINLDC